MSALSGIPALGSSLHAGVLAEIPSPSVGVWHLGPLPIRGYAMSILAAIIVAVWLTQRRLEARGARRGVAIDVSAWAVPFGILGGRIYHLITTPQPYFGEGGRPLDALAIWNGGLGIWGAISLGAVGAWIGCRRNGVQFRDFVDAAAPGVAIAQAMGRVGNWFNNEIYGRRTDLPWRLRIYEWDTSAGRAVLDSSGSPVVKGYFHPTFLYEALWCLLLAAVLILIERRWHPRPGQVFAALIMGYPIGRIVIENMRTDSANEILGQRVNTWVSIIVFALGAWLWLRFGRQGEREVPIEGDDGGQGDESADPDPPENAHDEHEQDEHDEGDDSPDDEADASTATAAEHDVSPSEKRRINK